jgi:hypothetical protein
MQQLILGMGNAIQWVIEPYSQSLVNEQDASCERDRCEQILVFLAACE